MKDLDANSNYHYSDVEEARRRGSTDLVIIAMSSLNRMTRKRRDQIIEQGGEFYTV